MTAPSPRSPRLLLAGYYGAGNAGDEAILAGLLAGLRSRMPDAAITVAAGSPEQTREEHGVAAVERADIPAMLAAMRAADLVVVGGGGIFEDYWAVPTDLMLSRRGGGLPYYAGLPVLATLAEAPCVICAVGVGPLHTEEGRRLAVGAFRLAAAATVRDRASRDLLLEIDPALADHVEVTADAAFLMPPIPLEPASELLATLGLGSGVRPIGVALRAWEWGAIATWQAEVAAALADVARTRGAPLLLLPFDREDAAVADTLRAAVGDAARVLVAPAGLSPAMLGSLIARCESLVAMRFHAALLGLRAGLLPLALAYDPKVTALMTEIGAADLALPPERWRREEVRGLFEAMRTDRRRERLHATVAALRVEAQRNVDRIVEVLARTAPAVAAGDRLIHRLAADRVLAAWQADAEVERSTMELRRTGEKLQRADEEIQRKGETLLRTGEELQRTSDKLRLVTEEACLAGEENRRLLDERERARAEIASTLEQLAFDRDQFRAERTYLLREIADASRRLSEFEGTVGYRVLSRTWSAARRWMPEGTRRRWLYHASRNLAVRLVGRSAPSGAMPAPVVEEPRAVEWRAELLAFADQVRERRPARMATIFSGTPLDENEGQRPMQLALALARRDTPVVFAYWRWSTDELRPQDRLADGILQVPLDRLATDPSPLLDISSGLAPELLAWFEFPWPGFFPTVAALNAAGWTTVYDVLDDWEEFHRLGQAIWFDDAFERHLLGAVDAVFAINEPLAERVRALGGRAVEVVPNGVRPGIEAIRTTRSLDRGAVTVGYFGYLASAWFDWQLVADAGRSRPAWKIYLIGYGGAPDGVELPANVVLLGRQPQTDLAAFAANWDVAIVPFKAEQLARGADPIKTYEYLAMGLPVVTTGVAAPTGAERVVTMAADRGQFVRAIEEAAAISHDEERRAERRAVAADCTWDRRLDAMLASVDEGRQRVAEKRELFRS